MALHDERLLIQIASYNTNLQGVLGLPQDLVDWLSPTFQVSSFLSTERRAPDIVAVGFQELLPLRLGLAGLSKSVINDRDALILSQIEAHASNKEAYSLIAKVVNVGVALLVYGRDDGVARRACDVQSAWTGCGPGYMGNKGAVGIRFRVTDTDGGIGETYTFVNCHLTAFDHKLQQRIADYKHIVGSLLFPSVSSAEPSKTSTLYETSHLFLLGDLNFRVVLPETHPLYVKQKTAEFSRAIESEISREKLKEFDQLTIEKRKGNIFIGLREGDFWRFKCSYKYKLGEVDKYSTKRVPSWTDRVLYATHSDSPDTPDKTNITNLLYTSIPSYTTSDHKPIVCLLLLPPTQPRLAVTPTLPMIQLPSYYKPRPDPYADIKRYTGKTLDRVIGVVWCLFALALFGAGSSIIGLFNIFLGLAAWVWWKKNRARGDVPV